MIFKICKISFFDFKTFSKIFPFHISGLKGSYTADSLSRSYFDASRYAQDAKNSYTGSSDSMGTSGGGPRAPSADSPDPLKQMQMQQQQQVQHQQQQQQTQQQVLNSWICNIAFFGRFGYFGAFSDYFLATFVQVQRPFSAGQHL